MFLGVDGGGTKTSLVLIDASGHIVARRRQQGAYHLQTGLSDLRKQIVGGVRAILADAAIAAADVHGAFFGLPAYGEDSRIVAELDALPEELLEREQYQCGNDMVCAWAGSLGGADGINIVAGTGSIAYGERQRQSARAGGWGELFSDEGSAYWLAVRGLKLFSEMSDGRRDRGPLYEILREAFNLSEDLDLSGRVMAEFAARRDRVAGLAQFVFAAGEQQDAAVLDLYAEAAVELVRIIAAVADRIGYAKGETVPVSYSGGVFGAGPMILQPMHSALGLQSRSYKLVEPLYGPDIGAAIYAARARGVVLTPDTT